MCIKAISRLRHGRMRFSMLSAYKTFLFDADGTLWNTQGLIRGAADLLHYLKSSGRNIFLVTNNSTKSVEQYLDKCRKLGLPLQSSEIICSANVTASTLARKGVQGPLYVIGQSGIGEELDKVGIEHFGIGPDDTTLPEFNVSHLRGNISGVIVGFDFYANYMKVLKAVNYIAHGASFYATNEDALLPCADYILPGTGSIVAAVKKASGVEPTVFGKPSKAMWEFIKDKYGVEERTTLIVGDRLDTDIEMGNASGLCTVCVMSGVTSESMLAAVRADPNETSLLIPDLVYPSILELYQQLVEEDARVGLQK